MLARLSQGQIADGSGGSQLVSIVMPQISMLSSSSGDARLNPSFIVATFSTCSCK